MVPLRRGMALVLLAVLAGPLAGCIGADDPANEIVATNGPGPTGPVPTTSAPPLPPPSDDGIVAVDDDTAIFAPEWQLGDWWTFEVEGLLRPTTTVTLKVVAVEDDHYRLAADEDSETVFNRLHDGPWIPRNETFGIQKDTLAFYSGLAYQDYLGFLKGVGASWTINLHRAEFTITKSVEEVAGAIGTGPGIVIAGAALNGNQLHLEYAPQARWINKMVVTNETGTLLFSYTLSAHGSGDGPAVRIWDVTDAASHDAQSPAYPVGYIGPEEWESDGAGDVLYIVFHMISGLDGGAAYASVWPPLTPEPFSETLDSGEAWFYIPYHDMAGRWHMAPAAVGGNAAADRAYSYIYLMQADITEA